MHFAIIEQIKHLLYIVFGLIGAIGLVIFLLAIANSFFSAGRK